MVLAYFDTNSGIAGDMTLAALVDAGADRNYIQKQIASLGLADVELQFSETYRQCFRALRLDVRHPPEHVHRHLADIHQMLEGSKLTEAELSLARRLFQCIAEAEAHVHGTSLQEVHFHEVGAIDSIVDIVGTAVGLQALGVEQIVASPTPTGCGRIQIAHGWVSVPAPATAEILKGVPIRSSEIEAELTTPTGAAILRTLADDFGPLPDMQIARIGYGAGHKELKEQANILRVILGTPGGGTRDEVMVLETNLDDISGEQLGYAIEELWNAGAIDVYTTSIGMKKNRPAVLLSVIASPDQRNAMEECMFRHTGTLGIRRSRQRRSKLQREIVTVSTQYGAIRVKLAWGNSPALPLRFAPEYEDCRRCAQQNGVPLEVVYRAAVNAAEGLSQSEKADIRRQTIPVPQETLGGQGHHDHGRHDHGGHDHGGHDHGGHDHGGHDHHH